MFKFKQNTSYRQQCELVAPILDIFTAENDLKFMWLVHIKRNQTQNVGFVNYIYMMSWDVENSLFLALAANLYAYIKIR